MTKRKRTRFTGVSKDHGVFREETMSEDMLRFAKHATAGMQDSHFMLGILDSGERSPRWYAFCLQIGACLMQSKPLLLIVPDHVPVPDKLRAAATAVETFRVGDTESLERATNRVFAAVGIVRTH